MAPTSESTTSCPTLTTPVEQLPGVGSRRARALSRLGLQTVKDLLQHYPLRYEQHLAEGAIDQLTIGSVGSARGTVVATRLVGPMMGGKARFQATLEDHSGRLALVWFNARYLRDRIHPGMLIRVQGKVGHFNNYPQIVNPTWQAIDPAQAPPPTQDRLRPVYPATEDLPAQVIEQLLAQVLPHVLPAVVDPLPVELVTQRNMPVLRQAFAMVHQPATMEDALMARRRLKFNELILLQLGISLKRHYNQTRLAAPALRWSAAIDQHIRARFPFALTKAQERSVREIAGDLQSSRPMNRLLQGDVGSGKTVVALYALLMAVADRRQGAIMTPTELLAQQHFASISRMLQGSNVRLELLTSDRLSKPAERARIEQAIEQGQIDIAIGTQALLTQSIRFQDLALVVVDEQHRFGVLQRAAFRTGVSNVQSPMSNVQSPKSNVQSPMSNVIGGAPDISPGATPEPINRSPDSPIHRSTDQPINKDYSPHYLVMTATPIPRTLSLTLFGDLDVSVIDQLPPGRGTVVTRVVGPEKADQVYRYMVQRLAKGEQAYVVVPTIDEQGAESAQQLKSVRELTKLLEDKFCRGFKVAAVHGQLKPTTRESIMQKFRAGEISVLVATTVIEVGVDVPNATVMVIEHAERFGLAQLHQLRGRVGRSNDGKQSLCALIAQPTTESAQKRMAAIAATQDGFKIAEQDLEIRGMGDFFGTRQHGAPPLRIAQFPDDMDLLLLARRDADQLVEVDPTLSTPPHQLLRRVLLQQYGDTLGLIDVG